jgi:hypothetical protein
MIRYFEVPGASADQIRLGDQYEDRQVAWHRYSADAARARRRCGRMSFFAAVHLVRKWHLSAVPTAPANVRSWVENGLNAEVAIGPLMPPNSDIGPQA